MTIYISEAHEKELVIDRYTVDSSLVVSVRTHQKYFQMSLEESIKHESQGLTLGIHWFSTGTNQHILRPFTTTQEHIDRFGLV